MQIMWQQHMYKFVCWCSENLYYFHKLENIAPTSETYMCVTQNCSKHNVPII